MTKILQKVKKVIFRVLSFGENEKSLPLNFQ